MTLLNLINSIEKPPKLIKTNIDFIDIPLKNGIELGQLISITGEQESGKTTLLNMILSGIAKKEKCLYFSLEFNKKQLKKHFINLLKHKIISKSALRNIDVITNETFDGNIDELLNILNSEKYKEYSIVAIDSAMMLYDNELKGEQEISKIFRVLHDESIKNNKIIFLIAQGSKEDNKDNRVSIFGSQKANHLIHIMLHLFYNRRKNERAIEFAKNKQNGFHGIIELNFDNKKMILLQKHQQNQCETKSDNVNNINYQDDIIVLEDEDEDTPETIKLQEELQEQGFNIE